MGSCGTVNVRNVRHVGSFKHVQRAAALTSTLTAVFSCNATGAGGAS